jgi:flagellar protein FliO/FliZ
MTRSRHWTNYFLALALIAGIFVAPGLAQDNAATSAATNSAPSPVAAEPAATPLPAESSAKSADDRIPFMAQSGSEAGAEAPSAAGLLMRTLGALLLIIGLIAAAAWGLRRFGGARFGAPSEDAPELAVLTTISLGDKRSLAAVRFGGRLLLIGSTAQSITLLATDDPKPVWDVQARSVADLLEEGETPSFEQSLIRAGQSMRNVPALPNAEMLGTRLRNADMDTD